MRLLHTKSLDARAPEPPPGSLRRPLPPRRELGAGGTVAAAALRDVAVQRFVEGKSVRKRVRVAIRLLNLVVG